MLDFSCRVLTTGIELGSYVHLVTRHTAVAQGLPDALFVAIGLSGVDMPVAELQRPAHGVYALRPVWDLPDAEPEYRDLVTVC